MNISKITKFAEDRRLGKSIEKAKERASKSRMESIKCSLDCKS